MESNRKIYNIAKFHNIDKSSGIFNLDDHSNSVTTTNINNGILLNKNLNRIFNFDKLIRQNLDEEFVNQMVTQLMEKGENCAVTAINRGGQSKSQNFNVKMMKNVLNRLFCVIEGKQNENDSLKYNVRMTCLEIQEEDDVIVDLNRTDLDSGTTGNLVWRRVSNSAEASLCLDSIDNISARCRVHRKYDISVYKCAAGESCSPTTLSFLFLDVTKYKRQYNPTLYNPMSLAALSHFITGLIYNPSRVHPSNCTTKFQNVLTSVFISKNCSTNLYFVTHISLRDKDCYETHQMLQYCGRIERLQTRLGHRRVGRDQQQQQTVEGMKIDKCDGINQCSDSEVTAQNLGRADNTFIRYCSDDDSHISRNVRAGFLSSDSDSGFKNSKMSATLTRLKTGAGLGRRKMNIHNVRQALSRGEETWIDGPGTGGGGHAHDRDRDRDHHRGGGGLHLVSQTPTSIPSNPTPTDESDVAQLSQWMSEVTQITTSPSPSPSPMLYHTYQYYDPYYNTTDYNNSFPRATHVFPLSSPPPPPPSSVLNQSQYLYQPQISYTESTKIQPSHSISIPQNQKPMPKSKSSFLSRSPLDLLKRTLFSNTRKQCFKTNQNSATKNSEMKSDQQMNYLTLSPASYLNDKEEIDDSDDSSQSSSESECNMWFRNMQTFKKRQSTNQQRPPSAPLYGQQASVPRMDVLNINQYNLTKKPTRQRSSSSGYGSVLTQESLTDQSNGRNSAQRLLTNSTTICNNSTSTSYPYQNQTSSTTSYEHLDPDIISERCEVLLKREKAELMIKNQESMIHEFNSTTKPLLSTLSNGKYHLIASRLSVGRLETDSNYLDDLEEESNIIRDTIAFYKSLVHLESSFLPSPIMERSQLQS